MRSSPECQVMTSKTENLTIEPVWVWGPPFAPMSLAEPVSTMSALIERGLPTCFITANTHATPPNLSSSQRPPR